MAVTEDNADPRGSDHAKIDPNRRGIARMLDKKELLALLSLLISFVALFISFRLAWIASDNEHRLLRAYAAPNAVRFDPGSVKLDIENWGQTPADHVRIFNNWEIRPSGGRDTFCGKFTFLDRDQCHRPDVSTATLMPRVLITTGQLLCDPVKQEVSHNGGDLVLYGRVEYSDVFGDAHRTTFCYFIGSDGALLCNCHNEIDANN